MNNFLLDSNLNTNRVAGVIYVVICIFVVVYMYGLVSTYPITSDAHQNLKMSYNLYNYGMITFDGDSVESRMPTNYREPVPVIVTAAYMYVNPYIDSNTTLTSLSDGENTKTIKRVNLFWVFFLLIGVGLLSFMITKNRWFPFLVLLFVIVYFIRFGNHFNALTTELTGAVFIVWSTFFLVSAVQKQKLLYYFLAGISISLLILTKAVFFYLSLLVLISLIFFNSTNQKGLKIGVFIIGVLFFVVPWLIRNYSIYNEIEITQRSGSVIYQRATLNKMNGTEMVGAAYLWGPDIYKDLVANTPLGAKEQDFEQDGKYIRVNRGYAPDTLAIDLGRPDLALTFFAQTRAEINRLQNLLSDGEKEGSRREAYKIMGANGKDIILHEPFKHTFLSLLFLWRSIWSFPNATIPFLGDTFQIYIHNILNLLSFISLMGVFAIAVFKYKPDYLVLTILPVSSFLLHAFITPGLPRLSEPNIPSMLLCFCLVIFFIFQRYRGILFK